MPIILPRPTRPTSTAALTLSLLALAGCGGSSAFTTTYPDGQPGPVATVAQKLESTDPKPGTAVAVGATLDGQGVFAYDLQAKRLLWRIDAVPASPPQVAGDIVVVHERGRIRLFSLASGELLEEREDRHMALMGGAGDGDLAAIVLSSGGSVGARSALWILRDGEIQTELDVHYALGAPAVAAGLVFVPWNNVFLSVLDPQGHEVTRVRIHEEVVSRAFAQDGDVYFGQLGMFRFDSTLLSDERAPAVYFRPQREELPGRPAFLPAANVPPPPVQSALHRVKLSFRADPSGGRLRLAHDHLYLTFYQQVFALHPSESSADWVYSHDRDLVGMQAGTAGVWLADEGGQVTLLDAEGRPRWSAQLGLEPSVVQFRVEGFSPALGPAEPAMSLADQLASAAMHPDARLVPSRAMAVSMLGPVEGDAASSHLIALCSDGSGPARVRQAACEALSRRESGKGPVLEALKQHEDYLTRTPAPPVAALSGAAMRMEARESLPLLLSHLRDPATPLEDLPALMEAIKQLADDEEAEESVHAFLLLYHADEEDPAMLSTLELAVDTLAQRRGAGAAPTLELIANDAFAMPPLRGYANQVLATLPQPEPEPGEESGNAEGDGAEGGGGEPARGDSAKPEPPPLQLDASHIEKTLAPVMNELRNCLRKSPKRPASARLTLVIDGEGDVILVRSLPKELLGCIEPLVSSVTFPPNKFARRQQLTYRLMR